jgi:hypothetical protein
MIFKKEYLTILYSHPASFWWIVGIAFFWGIGQFMGYLVLNSASSLSFVYSISSFLEIPVYLAIGILINYDFPNFYILISLALLVAALVLKPSQDKTNKRNLLKYSILITIGISLSSIIGHAFDGAFYKNILYIFEPNTILFGISIYILTTSLTLNIIYLLPFFKKPSIEEKLIIKKHFWIEFFIPIIWFIASLPEGYSFANLPLFTLTALNSFSFLIKIISDLKNKRISFNLRTLVFIVTVILSIVFSTLSLK